jgi:hypothetical protein
MAFGASALVNLLVYTPPLLVWIIGLVLSGLLWSRHRGVAAMLLAACLIAIFTEISGALLNISLPFLYSAHLRSATQLGLVFGVVGLLRSLLMAVAWGLLLGAVWRGVTSSANDPQREALSR